MAQPIELVIDLTELKATAKEKPIIPVERPQDALPHVLGFCALDLSKVEPEHLPIVETGLLVEAAAARTGIGEDTVNAVWSGPNGQLSVGVLYRVANNISQWKP